MMNNIPLLIYVAGVFDSLRNVFIAVIFISIITTIVMSITYVHNKFSGLPYSYRDPGKEAEVVSFARKFFRIGVTFTVLSFLVLTLVPDRNTVILASSAYIATEVLNTDDGKAIASEASGLALDSLKSIRKYLEETLQERDERTGNTRT